VFFCFVLFLWVWGLNSGLARQVLYCLNHTSSAFCSCYFGDEGLMNSARAGLEP
jgi:hypothetical protein